MRSSDRLVGSPSRQRVEQFHEARLVRITRGGFAIWLDPFGMLDPQVAVNLLPELGVGVDLVRHGTWLGEGFKHPRDDSHQGLGGIVDEPSRRTRAERPSEGTPNGGTHVLAVCATPGQLDYFVALALQQHGQQSALRKGRG